MWVKFKMVFFLVFVIIASLSILYREPVKADLIPNQAIRLRILAHSDDEIDQLAKRDIRDQIIHEIQGWSQDLDHMPTIDEARELISSHLSHLETLIVKQLQLHQLPYSYNIRLGITPFPTKMYGGTVYPAGEYEAVQITLGQGGGHNWWCVLFPPLCFIDASTGEAVAKVTEEKKVESRFFVAELWTSVTSYVDRLFS